MASLDDSTDSEAAPVDNDNVDVSGAPVAVAWIGKNGQMCMGSAAPDGGYLTFDLHFDASSHKAFFKLQAKVALRDRRNKTSVFLFIHPEYIQRLVVADDESDCAARETLGTSTYCLWFHLNTPAAFVVPKDCLLMPKQKSSQLVLESLQALSKETSFSLYLPTKTLPRARLLSLCEAISSQEHLKSMEGHSDIVSLYGGRGGRIFSHDDAADAEGTKTLDESPPSYDELAAGHSPPRPSPAQKPDRKRRRCSSDTTAVDQSVSIENMCSKIMKRIDQGFSELGTRMRHIEHRLNKLEARVEGTDELRDDVERQLYDMRREMDDTIDSRIEDQMFCARNDADEYIRDEMEEAEERIEDRLEDRLQEKILDHLSTTSVSLQFN